MAAADADLDARPDGAQVTDGSTPVDAHVGQSDAAMHPLADASVPPRPDAHVPAPPDASVPLPHPPDASVPLPHPPDASVPVPPPPDAGSTGTCHPLQLTAAAACTASMTGRVTACSITNGIPSQTGYLEVERANGTKGYLCATVWTSDGGYFFGDRQHLVAAASTCCGGPASTVAAPVTDPLYGTLHGPTHVKPFETITRTGGDLRENPFTVVISSPAAAAVYRDRVAQWLAWSGDGQAHPAPDGTGSYYFPGDVPVNYMLVRSADGSPMIIIAPEISSDPSFTTPLGHPTLGACNLTGGSPLAYIAGTVRGTIVTNASGRYGFENTVTAEALENVKDLFNCYGITITTTEFSNN
jgi:hypothetical protein